MREKRGKYTPYFEKLAYLSFKLYSRTIERHNVNKKDDDKKSSKIVVLDQNLMERMYIEYDDLIYL